MFSESDERNGLVRTTWKEIRSRVAEVEGEFASLVDVLSPDDSFPLYLAYYPYGAMDADIQSTLYPDMKGGFFRLSDEGVSKPLLSDLGYSINNTPLGMVLEKQIECFVDLACNEITIPSFIYTPGKFFPITKILNQNFKRNHAPYRLLYSTAGARSAFMLPHIGCNTNHILLQRDYKIKSSAPKSLYYHWHLFKEIIDSSAVNCDWRCCVVYFSKKWIDAIHRDKQWSDVKQYLQNKAWQQCDYDINRVHYDMIFSIIQQKRNLKPNPYLTDTAKHLFSIALGESPGYAPVTDESAMPAAIIQKAFIESYNMKKYVPVILHPVHYNFGKDTYPIYYSLQNPSTLVFSPKSSELSSTLSEMRELHHLLSVFSSELARDEGMCSSNSIMNRLSKQVKFDYFHNKLDSHQIVKHSSNLIQLDDRFNHTLHHSMTDKHQFACDGTFARGCVRISA